eukprot:52352-Eustigmatos_ZCMA.PRE.1
MDDEHGTITITLGELRSMIKEAVDETTVGGSGKTIGNSKEVGKLWRRTRESRKNLGCDGQQASSSSVSRYGVCSKKKEQTTTAMTVYR